jgi:hypothetical protein
LDVDSSLVEIHSQNKQETGLTYKGGFGFHPLLCFADATGEVLSGLLRPGNAGANTAADHVAVLDAALAQLPEDVRIGHGDGDDPALARREVICRSDSAGTTKGFLSARRARNVAFMTVAITNTDIQTAILDAEAAPQAWVPAVGQDGSLKEGSAVCELTSLVDLEAFPSGTRLIVRREPLDPGAQQSAA